jgi:hypothetical protein
VGVGWFAFSRFAAKAPCALPVALFFSVFLFLWPLFGRVLMELVSARSLQAVRNRDAEMGHPAHPLQGS